MIPESKELARLAIKSASAEDVKKLWEFAVELSYEYELSGDEYFQGRRQAGEDLQALLIEMGLPNPLPPKEG